MLETVALILSGVAYGAFYAGAPGRQSQSVGPPRLLLGAGTVLTVAALILGAMATRSAVGPVLVLTVLMAVASTLAMIGPSLLPDVETTRSRPTARPDATDRTPTRPVTPPPNSPTTSDR